MSLFHGFEELEKLVIHCATSQERYESQKKFTTLVFKNSSEMESEIFADILDKASRKSDLLLFEKDIFIFLMPATDREGAQHVFKELDEACKSLKNITTLVYPDDGLEPQSYFEKVKQVLESI